MDGAFLRDGGAGVAFVMAGIGALKFFFTASSSVARIPHALERGADALEKQATAAERGADVVNVLHELREGQEQIRISMSALTLEVQEVKGQVTNHG